MTDFRDFLFADQNLAELMAHVRVPKEPVEASQAPNPWPLFAAAKKKMEEERIVEAKKLLREITHMKEAESRISLWAWNALRNIGEHPNPSVARQVMGVIFEVPLPMGLDTLAAYDDGSARYLNQSGKIIIWDIADREITPAIAKITEIGQNIFDEFEKGQRGQEFDQEQVRFYLLTPGGLRLATRKLAAVGADETLFTELFIAGYQLMKKLIDRSQGLAA